MVTDYSSMRYRSMQTERHNNYNVYVYKCESNCNILRGKKLGMIGNMYIRVYLYVS